METSNQTTERTEPTTPTEAVEAIYFDHESLLEYLTAAHCGIYGYSPTNDWSLQFTFRRPELGLSGVETDPERPGWMRYRCDLTGMEVAVPQYAAVPVFMILEATDNGRSLVSSIRIHPDFLEDREYLVRMLVNHLRNEVESAVYEALQALHLLTSLDGAEELPGAGAITAASYPRREGYEAVDCRPIEPDDDS